VRIERSKVGRLVENRGLTFVVITGLRFSPKSSSTCNVTCHGGEYRPAGSYGGLYYFTCVACGWRGVVRLQSSRAPLDRLWLRYKVPTPAPPRIADPVEEGRARGLTTERRTTGGLILPP
jgi:hypothetical protein